MNKERMPFIMNLKNMQEKKDYLRKIHKKLYNDQKLSYKQIEGKSSNYLGGIDSRIMMTNSHPIISPNNGYILFNDYMKKQIYIHKIKDGFSIEGEPVISKNQQYSNYVFTFDSRFVICARRTDSLEIVKDADELSSSKIDVYDLKKSDPQKQGLYRTFDLIDRPNISYMNSIRIQILSSYNSYYYHDSLIGKELNGHIALSKSTGIIMFFEMHSKNRIRTVLLRYNGTMDDGIEMQEIVFTNHGDVLYRDGYEKYFISVYKHNYLLCVGYNKSKPGLKVSVYNMNMTTDGMRREEISIELSLHWSSRCYDDVDICPGPPLLDQYRYISYDNIHIVDRKKKELLIFNMNEIDASIIKFEHVYDHYRVYDDGKYIVCWDEKEMQVLYKHNDAYVSIYSYDSNEIVNCTLSTDMRNMIITTKNSVVSIHMHLFDHSTYDMTVDVLPMTRFDWTHETHIFKKVKGVDICTWGRYVRYTNRNGERRDVDASTIRGVPQSGSYQHYYDDTEKRIHLLHKFISETSVGISCIDTSDHTITNGEQRRTTEATKFIERRFLIQDQQGYMIEKPDKSIVIYTFKGGKKMELPQEYNNIDHSLYIHEDIVIIFKRIQKTRWSIMWRHYGDTSDTCLVGHEIDIPVYIEETERGLKNDFKLLVKYLEKSNRIVLLTWVQLMVIHTKEQNRVDIDSFHEARTMIVSKDGHYICVYEN